MQTVTQGQQDAQRGKFDTGLALATIDLYDRNCFRLLELPVWCRDRDITRRRDLVERAQRGGHQIPRGALPLLPRDPPPTEQEARDASHALQDAEQRLAHEFFWFWPLEAQTDTSDAALSSLVSGKTVEAQKLWRGSSNPAARHNLAILHHLLALALERQLLDRPEGAMVASAEAETHWQEAMRLWAEVAADERLWSRVTARIRAIDDPSLTTGTARRLQTTLPTILTLIDARLAIRALELDRRGLAERHAARIRATKLPQAGVEEGLRLAVEPLRSLIKSLCTTAVREAEADKPNADKVAERLLEQTATALATIDLLLPQDHPARQAEHDQVARAALSCQIDYGNTTKNWRRSLSLLDRIAPIAASSAARERIEFNQKIVKNNLEENLCWFCGERDAEEKRAIEVAMHGEVRWEQLRNGRRLHWSHRKVKVPRCDSCYQQTQQHGLNVFFGWLIGFTIVILSTMIGALGNAGGPGFFIGLLISIPVGILITGVLNARISSRAGGGGQRKKQRPRNEYPAIKNLLAQGWKFGEKPAEAQ